MARWAPSAAAPLLTHTTPKQKNKPKKKQNVDLEQQRLLTTPQGVGQSAVDPAIQLPVDGPEDAGAELDEVDDEAAHYEHEAHQQLQDEQALQVGQQSHGWGAWRAVRAPLYTLPPTCARGDAASELGRLGFFFFFMDFVDVCRHKWRSKRAAACLTTVGPFTSRVYTVLQPILPTWEDRRERRFGEGSRHEAAVHHGRPFECLITPDKQQMRWKSPLILFPSWFCTWRNPLVLLKTTTSVHLLLQHCLFVNDTEWISIFNRK